MRSPRNEPAGRRRPPAARRRRGRLRTVKYTNSVNAALCAGGPRRWHSVLLLLSSLGGPERIFVEPRFAPFVALLCNTRPLPTRVRKISAGRCLMRRSGVLNVDNGAATSLLVNKVDDAPHCYQLRTTAILLPNGAAHEFCSEIQP